MDELIGRHLSGEATDLEAHKLEAWRAASPENERAYQALRDVWLSTGEVREDPVPSAPPAELVVSRADERRRASARRARGRAILRSPWLAYAFAAACLAAVALFALPRIRAGRGGAALLTPTTSSTSAAHVTTITLSDGSLVRLAPATRLDFPPSGSSREVVLDGRAFFAVAPGEAPFVVRTDAGDFTVHGTRFEIGTEGAEARLVVVEGTVRVTGSPSDVSRGEVAYLRRGAPSRIVAADDVWALMDWGDGLLVFQSTPLDEVADEVGRHFGRRVEVSEALRGRRVTAWFEDESLEEVVAAVCLVVGARCEVGEQVVTVETR